MENTAEKPKRGSAAGIQKLFFRSQFLLILGLTLVLAVAGILINLRRAKANRDENLQNVAESIAQSHILTSEGAANDTSVLQDYLDSLKESLSDVDVISVVSNERIRLYHSNHELIGTTYDGTIPDFESRGQNYYAETANGPSGPQRRAYAAIRGKNGGDAGFVITSMLNVNILRETLITLGIFLVTAILAVLLELLISYRLSTKIKESLMGYEPETFSAMYKIRDNILESISEGIVEIDKDAKIQFANAAAERMMGGPRTSEAADLLKPALSAAESEFNVPATLNETSDILLDRIPVRDGDTTVGAIGILHDRTEYTKLMEDLTGTRYLVDSMRANNHDFTNKLHVILGLIQMGMYDKATSYIENITIVQRETISRIMRAIDEPAVAALLIGKTARASELNIKFRLREGSSYHKADYSIPAESLITIIGNLIDNAFDSMNEIYDNMDRAELQEKELLFGMYSTPGNLLITSDDTGSGISPDNVQHIFENGWSTKGEGRGTGMYQVKKIIDGLGGEIHVESQEGVGTSFSVMFRRGGKRDAECTVS